MNSITQDIWFKQSVVEYSLKHGVTEAAKRYKQHRKTFFVPFFLQKVRFSLILSSFLNITANPASNSFQVLLIVAMVNFSINVPITSAGIKRQFSSFDKTETLLSGTDFVFASM